MPSTGTEFIAPPQELVDEFNITWDAAAYGTGPLKLGIADFQYKDIKDYWAAFEGEGTRRLIDGNNGDNAGGSWYPNTMDPRTGERQHARLAYYDTISSRANLHVLLENVATELVFDINSSKRLVARESRSLTRRRVPPRPSTLKEKSFLRLVL